MRLTCRTIIAVITHCYFVGPLGALAAPESIDLTVYNQDFALITEKHAFNLQQGENNITLPNVAALIEPSSVVLRPIGSSGGFKVWEQNFDYDLASFPKLLHRFTGKEIEIQNIVDQKTGEIRTTRAKLISSGYSPPVRPLPGQYAPQPSYQSALGQLFEIDGKITSAPGGNIVLPVTGTEIVTQPTLSWKLYSEKGGAQQVSLSYIASGLRWNADYIAQLRAKDDAIDLTGWVTLDNRSGAEFKNAKLKLMAGDVNKISPLVAGYAADALYASSAREMKSSIAGPQFSEKSFFEYHLYTLDRTTDLANLEIKQLELVRAQNIPVKKRFIFDGFVLDKQYSYNAYNNYQFREQREIPGQNRDDVWVVLELQNSKKRNLGFPLPEGKLRVYKQDSDGSEQFIGEDLVQHTPVDETVRLYGGNAFDIIGERKQTNFTIIERNVSAEETFEITLKNHKKEDVQVTVREHPIRSREWEIRNATQEQRKVDQGTVEFDLTIPKDGQTKLTYTVRYRW